jgi:hypothetical protein
MIHEFQLAAGRYRIFSGTQSARSYPGTGPNSKSFITMSDQFASIWEQVNSRYSMIICRLDRYWNVQWDINSDGNDGYLIQSAGTGARAYADQKLVS